VELAARLQDGGPAAAPDAVAGWQGDPEYGGLLAALGHDPATLDDLAERTGQPAGVLSSMLLMLELEGVVGSLAGNRYQRLS
jgi:DNA processing protein